MEDWAQRAMQRWPNVPALFSWLALDRRGRWLIRGEPITRPQIIDTINRNYEADAHGRWFFQNGPQRGYMRLDYAPLVLFADGDGLRTHTGLPVERALQACLDEEGSLTIVTEHGPGLVADHDLGWVLDRLSAADGSTVEDALTAALVQASGSATVLRLDTGSTMLDVQRLDADVLPMQLGFVREPQPRDGERAAVGEAAAPD